MINVKEKTIGEIREKIKEMNTDLNKINYLESALKVAGFTFEIKRQIWGLLADLYENRKMFDKAGKAMANKAGVEILIKEKLESYLKAGELFAKAGRIDDVDDMFTRAMRDANYEQAMKIKLARKNIYFVSAQDLERQNKKASAVKYYERLIKMDLDELEKKQIKEKLIETYKALGKFREIELLEGV